MTMKESRWVQHHQQTEYPMKANMTRRRFLANGALAATLAGGIPALRPTTARAQSGVSAGDSPRYRVAVIGHTGRGDYGHDLHLAWNDIARDQAQVVALADPDPTGRAAAIESLGGGTIQPFDDWQRMLDEVKPDILTICPRYIDVHKPMLMAAAESGIKGVFCEKPLCDTLADIDELIAMHDRTGMQVVMAHQTRYSPIWRQVKEIVAAGKLGNILEIRARGKEDARSGIEDMLVLGTHLFDMVQDAWGMPQWCFGTVTDSANDYRPITRDDLREASDGMFRIAGDTVHAMYGLPNGKMLYFDSVNDDRGGARFGLRIYGSQGIIEVGMGYMPPAYFFPHRTWSPIRGKRDWMPISSAGLNKEEPIPEAKRALHWGNVAACEDLLRVLETPPSGEIVHPVADIRQARTALEMVIAPIASSLAGTPVNLPLTNRGNPF